MSKIDKTENKVLLSRESHLPVSKIDIEQAKQFIIERADYNFRIKHPQFGDISIMMAEFANQKATEAQKEKIQSLNKKMDDLHKLLLQNLEAQKQPEPDRGILINGKTKPLGQKQPAMSLEECKDVVLKRHGYLNWDRFVLHKIQNQVINELAELYANQFREANKDLRIFRICSSCNTEFELALSNGTSERCSAFPNCPHCGARNDVWISVR